MAGYSEDSGRPPHDPGSDWRLHRHWYEHSALRDLLGCDRVIASTTLYRCLDKLRRTNRTSSRSCARVGRRCSTRASTFCSTDQHQHPPFEDGFGHARTDCQVVIALVVGRLSVGAANNTRLSRPTSTSDRVWIMDPIPTEETLEAMREGETPVRYLVGTPRPAESAREVIPRAVARGPPSVDVQADQRQLFVLVRGTRVLKERSMRRRRLKKRSTTIEPSRPAHAQAQTPVGLGSSSRSMSRTPRGAGRPRVHLPPASQEAATGVSARPLPVAFEHDRRRPCRVVAPLHAAHRNRAGVQGAEAQSCHPIFHQLEQRIEAHIFVSFIAYCRS